MDAEKRDLLGAEIYRVLAEEVPYHIHLTIMQKMVIRGLMLELLEREIDEVSNSA